MRKQNISKTPDPDPKESKEPVVTLGDTDAPESDPEGEERPNFPKRYTDSGPLIESTDGVDDNLPTLRINRKHKHYEKLRDLLRD